MDLTLAGRVAVTSRRIEVVDPAAVEDRRLNNALTSLLNSRTAPSLSGWIRGTPRGYAMVTTYLSVLADQRAVRIERPREPAAGPPRVRLLDPARRKVVCARLDRVARGMSASDADRALAVLVHACALDRYLYPAPFGLRARGRLGRLAQPQTTSVSAPVPHATVDAALAQDITHAISQRLTELTRELVPLVRHEGDFYPGIAAATLGGWESGYGDVGGGGGHGGH